MILDLENSKFAPREKSIDLRLKLPEDKNRVNHDNRANLRKTGNSSLHDATVSDTFEMEGAQ